MLPIFLFGAVQGRRNRNWIVLLETRMLRQRNEGEQIESYVDMWPPDPRSYFYKRHQDKVCYSNYNEILKLDHNIYLLKTAFKLINSVCLSVYIKEKKEKNVLAYKIVS